MKDYGEQKKAQGKAISLNHKAIKITPEGTFLLFK